MEPDSNIIGELDFVLTHPACNVTVVEKFYNNCLYVYETVPLFFFVDHMMKTNPKLLKDWSKLNKTVQSLLAGMQLGEENPSSSTDAITINIDLSVLSPAESGIYKVTWKTEMEDPIVNAHFKTKSLIVFDKKAGKVKLIGIRNVELNHYNLYVKIGGM
jgi:hypothetical protein